jgi:small subunit ribosomal protein S9
MKGPDLHRGTRRAFQSINWLSPACSKTHRRFLPSFLPTTTRKLSSTAGRRLASVHSDETPDIQAAPLPRKFLRQMNEDEEWAQEDSRPRKQGGRNEENERKKKSFDQAKTSLLRRVRIVPASPSYFTARPSFTDDYLYLQALLRKYQTLPVMPPGQAPRVAWKALEQYKDMVGSEPVKAAGYHRLLELLQRLNYINTTLVPQEVTDTLERYKRDINPHLNIPNPHFVDEHGRSLGVGRRKSSTARAYLVEGDGEVLVNGKSLTQYFGRVHDRESAIWALKATERVDKYNVFALVQGGGTTGQAEALTLAVTKALMVHEPLLKPALRRGEFQTFQKRIFFCTSSSHLKYEQCFCDRQHKHESLSFSNFTHAVQVLTLSLAGCVTRDPRKVERKKPGHLKARKKPAWVKR